MSEDHDEIVIVKRRGGHEDEHHGGAWKIAFADFMTAMMTFFLVLWIINATDKNTKSVIARYFNPVRLENPAKAQKGVHNENGVTEPDPNSNGAGAAPTDAKDSKTSAAPPKKEDSHEKEHSTKADAESAKPKSKGMAEPSDPAHPKSKIGDDSLFADPYGSLDRIAGAPPSAPLESAEAGKDDSAAQRTTEAGAFRDPFEAVSNESEAPSAKDNPSVQPPPASSARTSAESSGKTVKPKDPDIGQTSPASAAELPAPQPAASAAAPSSGQRALAVAAAVMKELKAKMGPANQTTGPAIEVRPTKEGLLISLTDQFNFSMFPVGSAEPQPQVVRAMAAIAETLASRSGDIVVRGHTDGRQYQSQKYDNWRLSEARAQMAYYMLTRARLPGKRVEHIEGYADRRPRNLTNPYAAENRRIEILLREVEP